MVSNLPRDLVEEVLSRVPVTSLRRVRSTCKTWNTLSKSSSFAKKHLGRQARAGRKSMMVLMIDFRVYLMSVDQNHESCLKPEGTLISLDNSYQIEISQVFHCDGLLLCISKDYTKLVVCNPYLGQTRWIQPTYDYDGLHWYSYALGYGKSCHKILRFIDLDFVPIVEFEIYDFNFDSWRVLDITPDWQIDYYDRGVSLKGNTYWFANEKPAAKDGNFLICFDFTRERFGPRLSLPPMPSIEWFPEDTLNLSSVREEQLAVFFQRLDTYQMEIWVTTKIEPNTVSWNTKVFLSLDMKRLASFCFQFSLIEASFFIDEEKKVVVVFDKGIIKRIRNVAYVVGVDGSLKEMDLGNFPYRKGFPRVCSYIPSLTQLN